VLSWGLDKTEIEMERVEVSQWFVPFKQRILILKLRKIPLYKLER
jgi:hypothetical protein